MTIEIGNRACWVSMSSLALTLVFAGLDGTRAQEGHLGHGHDKWHQGFYDTLLRPDTRTSCCNLTDCRPTQGRVVGDHYEIKVNGAWVSVPADKIVKKSAPDMGFHVCAPTKFRWQAGKPLLRGPAAGDVRCISRFDLGRFGRRRPMPLKNDFKGGERATSIQRMDRTSDPACPRIDRDRG